MNMDSDNNFTNDMSHGPFRSGYISITGRPNVGKSTFMNRVLGQKISIVTSKPQTTRNRILGIKNLHGAQVIFLDTPGIHKPKHGLGEFMNKEAMQAVKDVDVVLFLVEPEMPSKQDSIVVRSLRGLNKPVVLLVNKCDRVKKESILPVMAAYAELFEFDRIFPVSALKGEGLDEVLQRLVELLPEGPQFYPEDMITDNLERFLVAEMVREKVMIQTDEEVPHATAVEVMEWTEREEKIFIRADIIVEKPGQKGIIIGKKGEMLKRIGTEARADIESLLGVGIYLELFVKVKDQWRRKRSVLTDLGF
jgi:GTP-binding protein Era